MKPRFTGGTLAEHILFVVSLCRFQHHTLPLASVHYLTWSIVHLALHSIAWALFGPLGSVVLGLSFTAWALRLDTRIGVVFGVLQLAYSRGAAAIAPTMTMPSNTTAALAFACLVGAIVCEAASHVVLQGYPPRPPGEVTTTTSPFEKLAFVGYFVVTFGLFFLTLDLAMRLWGYRPALHADANAQALTWHADALRIGGSPREMDLHRRAISDLSADAGQQSGRSVSV